MNFFIRHENNILLKSSKISQNEAWKRTFKNIEFLEVISEDAEKYVYSIFYEKATNFSIYRKVNYFIFPIE